MTPEKLKILWMTEVGEPPRTGHSYDAAPTLIYLMQNLFGFKFERIDGSICGWYCQSGL